MSNCQTHEGSSWVQCITGALAHRGPCGWQCAKQLQRHIPGELRISASQHKGTSGKQSSIAMSSVRLASEVHDVCDCGMGKKVSTVEATTLQKKPFDSHWHSGNAPCNSSPTTIPGRALLSTCGLNVCKFSKAIKPKSNPRMTFLAKGLPERWYMS